MNTSVDADTDLGLEFEFGNEIPNPNLDTDSVFRGDKTDIRICWLFMLYMDKVTGWDGPHEEGSISSTYLFTTKMVKTG